MTNSIFIGDVEVSVTYEDPRYKTLVVHYPDHTEGYAIEDDKLRRICICDAHCSYDCVCGAWETLNE